MAKAGRRTDRGQDHARGLRDPQILRGVGRAFYARADDRPQHRPTTAVTRLKNPAKFEDTPSPHTPSLLVPITGAAPLFKAGIGEGLRPSLAMSSSNNS